VFVEEPSGRYRRIEVATAGEGSGFIGVSAGLKPGERVVFEGRRTRPRTVLVNPLLAILGPLVMTLSNGIGSETRKPLAAVVIDRLSTTTLQTHPILPPLYLAVEGRSRTRATDLEG